MFVLSLVTANVATLFSRSFFFIMTFRLSSNSLGNKGLKKLLELLPSLGAIREIKYCIVLL